MGAVLGLHDSVVHVVEGGGLGMVNALVLVVSHAPLVWTADVINSMFDLCNCNRIDADYAMFGISQSISTSHSYYSVSVDVSTASSLDHSSSPGLVDNHSHLPRLFRQQLSHHIRYYLPLLYLFQDCLLPCCYFCHPHHHHHDIVQS